MSISVYKVKEIYYTLQGEGYHAGRPAVFLRFSGCNLWSGREEDRHKAVCDFCDTDFRNIDGVMGGHYSAQSLSEAVASLWPDLKEGHPLVVCTGGEPLLQLDTVLTSALRQIGFEIAIETNGTIPVPKGVDWICVSPKAGSNVVVTSGDELKVVYPQSKLQPEDVQDWNFSHYFLQPMENMHWEQNTKKTIDYCKSHPQWRLSMQSHKYLKIP